MAVEHSLRNLEVCNVRGKLKAKSCEMARSLRSPLGKEIVGRVHVCSSSELLLCYLR